MSLDVTASPEHTRTVPRPDVPPWPVAPESTTLARWTTRPSLPCCMPILARCTYTTPACHRTAGLRVLAAIDVRPRGWRAGPQPRSRYRIASRPACTGPWLTGTRRHCVTTWSAVGITSWSPWGCTCIASIHKKPHVRHQQSSMRGRHHSIAHYSPRFCHGGLFYNRTWRCPRVADPWVLHSTVQQTHDLWSRTVTPYAPASAVYSQ